MKCNLCLKPLAGLSNYDFAAHIFTDAHLEAVFLNISAKYKTKILAEKGEFLERGHSVLEDPFPVVHSTEQRRY